MGVDASTEVSGPLLRHLALMICGEHPGDYFPYRSGGMLTEFFNDLWMDYQHDGSTRRFWVENVLRDLAQVDEQQYRLTEDLSKAIAHIVNPLHFRDQEQHAACLLYTSPSPRDGLLSRMPSSA